MKNAHVEASRSNTCCGRQKADPGLDEPAQRTPRWMLAGGAAVALICCAALTVSLLFVARASTALSEASSQLTRASCMTEFSTAFQRASDASYALVSFGGWTSALAACGAASLAGPNATADIAAIYGAREGPLYQQAAAALARCSASPYTLATAASRRAAFGMLRQVHIAGRNSTAAAVADLRAAVSSPACRQTVWPEEVQADVATVINNQLGVPLRMLQQSVDTLGTADSNIQVRPKAPSQAQPPKPLSLCIMKATLLS